VLYEELASEESVGQLGGAAADGVLARDLVFKAGRAVARAGAVLPR
jgi:hypothetical protein